MYKRDFSVADLIIVLGTSLKVEPFGSIIDECPKSVPRVLMNKHLVGPWKSKKLGKKDISILGDLIECLDMLMISVGWDEELKQLTARELDILVSLAYFVSFYNFKSSHRRNFKKIFFIVDFLFNYYY